MSEEKVERKCGVGKEGLQSLRVLQRNLVYVVGVPSEYGDEEFLRSARLFGGFGEIVKIVVAKRKDAPKGREDGAGYRPRMSFMLSAYITYRHVKDAVAAIKSMDGAKLGDRILRCTFGTTKYCSFFLRNIRCTNEECLYLHERGADEDSFSKEEMAVLKTKMDGLIANDPIVRGCEVLERVERVERVERAGAANENGLAAAREGGEEEEKEKEFSVGEGDEGGEREDEDELSGLRRMFLYKPKNVVRRRYYPWKFNPFAPSTDFPW